MTLRTLLLLKAFVCLSIPVTFCAPQSGFDPFAIYQGSPVPHFPRNTQIPGSPTFKNDRQPRKPQRNENPFFKPQEGLQPYSSKYFVPNGGKSTSSLPKEEIFKEKFRFNDDYFGSPSPRPGPRPQYLDKRPNRHHFSRPKPGYRPETGREQLPYYPQASTNNPMIFSFRLNRKFWDEELKSRVNSLQNVDFVEEMEGYAKPSMQIGYRLMEWFRGIGGKDSKADTLVTKSSAEKVATTIKAKSSEKIAEEPPVYFSHTKSSTEVVRGGNLKRGAPHFPPIAFSAHPQYDHTGHSDEHGDLVHGPGIYGNSPGSEIPLGNILKAKAGNGKPNFNPKCNKGGSMIFCNSDALIGLLNLLEEHMGKSEKTQGNYGHRDEDDDDDEHYKTNSKSPGGRGGPMRLEVIEMDPFLNKDYPEKPRGSKDYNQLHDVDYYRPNPNDYGSHGSSGYGYEDPNREIEVVIVVHTEGGSYGKTVHKVSGHDGYGYKDNIKNVHDKFRKPYRHFDDDEEQNSYDKKFDRLKKVIDIVRQRNNKIGGQNYEGWQKNNYGRGNQYGYGQGHGSPYGQGNKYKGDDYWNSLLNEYRFGNYIPLQNSNDGPSRVRPHVEEDPNPNGFNDGGLFIDMRDNDYYNYGRLKNPDRRGRTGEKYFGQAREGKSKHASKEERDVAIRTKIEQVYLNKFI